MAGPVTMPLRSWPKQVGTAVITVQDAYGCVGTHSVEVTDDVVSVDRAMRWGFNWALGPFEIWDAIGVQKVADRLSAEIDERLPRWGAPRLEAWAERAKDELARIKVTVLPEHGEEAAFVWILARVRAEGCDGCWMTSTVMRVESKHSPFSVAALRER